MFACIGDNHYNDEKLMLYHRLKMVEEQIEGRGITNKRVLEAMRTVPRHLFVPERCRTAAYADSPLPIGEGQTISQPYIVALMTELLDPQITDRVLEVGTGSGYQAAVLSELCREVYTIEIIGALAEAAARRLEKSGYDNVFVRQGDGFEGWKERAPFDGIIVTAAPPEIPPPLIEQLKIGGRLVIPVGPQWRWQYLYVVEKTSRGVKKTEVAPVRFVPMTGKGIENFAGE